MTIKTTVAYHVATVEINQSTRAARTPVPQMSLG